MLKKIKICIALTFCICCVILLAIIAVRWLHSIIVTGKHIDPPRSIEITVHSWEEFEQMRSVVSSEDDARIDAYLQTVQGSNAIDGCSINKDTLVHFLALLDTVPYVELIDGEVTSISYLYREYNPANIRESISVQIQAENGDSVNLYYELSDVDVAGAIKQVKADTRRTNLLWFPRRNQDGNVIFYVETREVLKDTSRDLIRWYAEVDGVYTYISYNTADASKVKTKALIRDLKITSLSQGKKQ